MGGILSYQNNSEDYSDDSDFSENEEFVSKNSPSKPQEVEDGYNPMKKGEESFDSLNSICFDSATDAVNAEASSATVQITMSLKEVLDIEEQLDTYEKVSLIYLLEDNPEGALQELIKLLNGQSPKLLHNWAKTQHLQRQKWQEKFVEAMTIIQNYGVLAKLGFKRKDLDVRFLPRRSFTSEYVNRVKKALYFVCENLTPPDVDNLVKFVAGDFASKGLEMRSFDSSYLEMYLLHWEIIGYIKHDNLNNLYSILKRLELFDLSDHLKLAVPVFQEQVLNNQKNDPLIKSRTSDSGIKKEKKKAGDMFDVILGETTLEEFVSGDPSLGTDNTVRASVDDNRYEIDSNNPGACLIINQENFYTEVLPQYKHLLPQTGNKLDPRLGTEKDKQELESTFKMFGFKTAVVNDLKHKVIPEKITEFIEKITMESSLVICIMSHGDEGVIYGVNSCQVTVKSIQNLMCTKNRKNLTGKPKILILQSCQGTRCQTLSSYKDQEDMMTTDGPTTSKQEAIPPRADLFTFWATVPGFGAIRHKRNGSWFIQSLCEKMKTLGNTYHFEDICTDVIADVTSKKWCQNTDDVVAMVPLKDSTFRKKFFLPPIKG